MIVGIDEAGRGSLVGPLVIAFVFSDHPLDFVDKDSKQLSPKEREQLYQKIKQHAKVVLVKLSPSEIDANNINWLELQALQKVLSTYKAEKAFIDAFTDPKKIESVLPIPVQAEFKADEKYSIVAAASIAAKVERDKEIAKIADKIGFFGSGYPSDPITRDYVKNHPEKIEPYVRKKWSTLKELLAPKQHTLDD
ncbi:MAG: ribonuclease HII [Candidatus Micrarchaeota archaeon]|nr:ribonuclease HII [Candidatus Micrarchaeota archaeon]